MKKLLIIFLVATSSLLCAVYIFIPNIIPLRASSSINVTGAGIHRQLSEERNITKWWPGKISMHSMDFNGFNYTIHDNNLTVLPVSIKNENTDLSTSIFFIPLAADSTRLDWVGRMPSSYNPFKRFRAYLKAKKINDDMALVLEKIKSFHSNPKNIYEFNIRKETVVDSLLIQTSGVCKDYPTTQFIYSLISKLKRYAAINLAKETGYPMLNISRKDSQDFFVKVAIPLDRALPDSGIILHKRMLGRGKILVIEVKGPNRIASRAIEQIEIYARDYGQMAPAIPFYSLVTDRTQEADSNKWITKIFYPVM